MNAEFANALALIRALPDGVSAEELRSKGPETERAAVLINTVFETMGLLVFERLAQQCARHKNSGEPAYTKHDRWTPGR